RLRALCHRRRAEGVPTERRRRPRRSRHVDSVLAIGGFPSALRRRALPRRFLARGAFLGDLPPRAARFGEADRDGLLATLDRLSGTARLELAALHLVHGALDLLGGLLAVLSTTRLLGRHWNSFTFRTSEGVQGRWSNRCAE